MSRAIHKMRGRVSFVTLTDTDITQNNTNNPLFTDMDAGDADAARVLIAVIACQDASDDDSTFWPATCTIGGVTADNQVSMDTGFIGKAAGAAVYSAVVPNGTTATVDITINFFPGTMDDWVCALFRSPVVNVVPTPTDTGSSVVLDTSSAKFVVLAGADKDGATPGSFTGGGNMVEAVKHNAMVIAYDTAPLGGATDSYSASAAETEAGACFV